MNLEHFWVWMRWVEYGEPFFDNTEFSIIEGSLGLFTITARRNDVLKELRMMSFWQNDWMEIVKSRISISKLQKRTKWDLVLDSLSIVSTQI